MPLNFIQLQIHANESWTLRWFLCDNPRRGMSALSRHLTVSCEEASRGGRIKPHCNLHAERIRSCVWQNLHAALSRPEERFVEFFDHQPSHTRVWSEVFSTCLLVDVKEFAVEVLDLRLAQPNMAAMVLFHYTTRPRRNLSSRPSCLFQISSERQTIWTSGMDFGASWTISSPSARPRSRWWTP